MPVGIGGTLRYRKSRRARPSTRRGAATRTRSRSSGSTNTGRADPVLRPLEEAQKRKRTKMIRIGANPIGWSNDDLRELGGETPLETCLAEAREAGFEGMELGHKFPREPGALRAALAPFGLACVSGWYSAELLTRSADEEMKALRPHLDLLKAMGSTVLVFAET